MPKTTPMQSADRIFAVMEIMSFHPRGISLADICTATGLAKSTAMRMVMSLVSNGYAVQDPDTRKYRLTMRMFEVGSRVADGSNLLLAARVHLEELARRSGETVHLVTRVDNEVVYIYKEEGASHVVRMASSVGLKSPMYCTGVGKCILAHLEKSEVCDIFNSSDIVRYTDNTITSLDVLLDELEMVRENGYAIDNEEHEQGVCCIAAPILSLNNKPIASISLSAPKLRLDQNRILELSPLVVKTAKKISRSY